MVVLVDEQGLPYILNDHNDIYGYNYWEERWNEYQDDEMEAIISACGGSHETIEITRISDTKATFIIDGVTCVYDDGVITPTPINWEP